MALVDADYGFRVIQVGDFGRTSHGGVYAGSELGKEMESGTLQVPCDVCLPDAEELGEVPLVTVGDAAFPLKKHLMRPDPGQNLTQQKRIFNDRLSRPRMVIENAFGILASRWRIFHGRINLHPKQVDTLVVAACILHNFLLCSNENQRFLDDAGEKGQPMASVQKMRGHGATREAWNVRETFCNFFNSPAGGVSWQDRMI